jgi:hypothetical protein
VWRLMRAELLSSTKLFVDETTAPVLDPGRGRTKRAAVRQAFPIDGDPGPQERP